VLRISNKCHPIIMGIKNLNRYLLKHCSTRAIKTVSLHELKHRTIVVDTYIYIYKYLAEERLKERFEEMISSMKSKAIRPIFVFDGKPPEEKKELLAIRRELKRKAELRYNELITRQYHSDSETAQSLKKQFIRVVPSHIQDIKEIMKRHKVEYIDAPEEADRICAQYVLSKKAWACMSDDMDMFVYGCTRVLRSCMIEKALVDLYMLPVILCELRMTMDQFRDICVLSGTDYTSDNSICLFDVIRLFRSYQRLDVTTRQTYTFYEWLLQNTDCIRDYEKLQSTKKMFMIQSN
jgi:flap endonuclease-1